MDLFLGSLDLGVGVPELARCAFGVLGCVEVAFVAKEVFAEVSKVVVVAVELAEFVDVDGGFLRITFRYDGVIFWEFGFRSSCSRTCRIFFWCSRRFGSSFCHKGGVC